MRINGRSVSRETQERLEHFAMLFQKWARTINLVAPSTREELWDRHISDSAQVVQLSPGPFRWVDLGSGGGFPGIITAIFLAEDGEGWVDLIESNQKKAAFLRVALQETGGRGAVHCIRIEKAHEEVATADRVSARALANLNQLLIYSETWLTCPQTRAFFHKGRDYAAEVRNARDHWEFDLVQHQSAVQLESVILEITNLRRKET